MTCEQFDAEHPREKVVSSQEHAPLTAEFPVWVGKRLNPEAGEGGETCRLTDLIVPVSDRSS